jgi:uncharacterized protein (DUF433 family)
LVSGKEILEDYPNLTREDVQAALAYCVKVINIGPAKFIRRYV